MSSLSDSMYQRGRTGSMLCECRCVMTFMRGLMNVPITRSILSERCALSVRLCEGPNMSCCLRHKGKVGLKAVALQGLQGILYL